MVRNWKRIIRFLSSVVFFTAIAVGMPQMARAAEEIAINETNFPDANFRSYVSSSFDLDNNNMLSTEEIAYVTSIYVYNKDISSLKGIEYFAELTYLNCEANKLTNLDVSNNIALTYLNCSSPFNYSSKNELTSLDISNNTALTYLNCEANKLTNLDVSNNTALTYLNCSSNKLTSLDVSNNTVLTELICAYNELMSLNVSNNTALTYLNCSSNKLTSLDVSNNTVLISLACTYNELTNLDISHNMALQFLACDVNKLTNLDVSNNMALTTLWCVSNELMNLDVSKNTALTELSCASNELTSLDVSNNTMLTSLACDINQLTTLDVSKNTVLTSLACAGNQLTTLDISQNIALTYLYCNYSQLTELKLNSQTYDKLLLYKNYLHGDVNLSDLQNITETATNDSNTVSLLKVTDITKPATYKVDGKDFTIIYTDKVIMPSIAPTAKPSASPSASPSAVPSAKPSESPSGVHIFSDYTYATPVSGSAVIYGNGFNKKIDGKRVNNTALTVYTDILASYKHTPNSNGTVKSTVGKVIVAATKTADKPAVDYKKNKVTDTSASKIAKAKIKNGQITVTAVGKEGGLVYLWVIDTGSKGISASCPIDVKLAPKKLEVQSSTGTKLTKTKLQNGTTLDVHIAGLVGSAKTEDCTYTATVDNKYNSYVQINSKGTTGQDFTITAKGIKNDKDTKAAITFTCDQNGKKVKFSLTITK